MKKIFEFIGLGAFILFSFYYTEKAAIYAGEQNPIMQNINNSKEDHYIESTNAIVENNTIIPGLYGSEINVNKSFSNMKNLGTFNKYYLIFDYFPPEITLEDHIDKTIISGNNNVREVSIIITSKNHQEILTSNEITFSYAGTLTNYQIEYENINTESNADDFKQLNKLIKEANSNICLTNTRVNITECKNNNYYLVNPSLIMTNNNLIDIKTKLSNGSIIYINEDTSNEQLLLLIKEIKYKGLEIVKLSDLIKENK